MTDQVPLEGADQLTRPYEEPSTPPSKLSMFTGKLKACCCHPRTLCISKYGCVWFSGLVVGVGIVVLTLMAYGVIGGEVENPSLPCQVAMGTLSPPTVQADFRRLDIDLPLSNVASGHNPVNFVVQVMKMGNIRGRGLREVEEEWDDLDEDEERYAEEGLMSRVRRLTSLDPENFKCEDDRNWEIPFQAQVPYAEGATVSLTGPSFTPGSSWLVRYKVQVKDGRMSTPSIPLSVTLKDSSPPSAPQLLALSTSKESVSVKWAHQESSNGESIVEYQAQYGKGKIPCSCAGCEAEWTSALTYIDPAGASQGSPLKFQVDGLTSGEAVSMRVRAKSSAGEGEWSPPYLLSSDREGAVRPPEVQGLTVEAVSWDKAKVKWDPPEGDSGAHILRFGVRNLELQTTKVVDGKETELVWEGLEKDTTYSFQVYAVNSRGFSALPPPLSISTPSECDPDPVSAVEIKLKFSNGFSVGWRERGEGERECFLPVSGHEVKVKRGEEVVEERRVEEGGYRFVDFDTLEQETEYTIEVRAYSTLSPSRTLFSPPSSSSSSTLVEGRCTERDDVRWLAAEMPYYNNKMLTNEIARCAKDSLGDPKKTGECIGRWCSKNSKNSPFNLKNLSKNCLFCMEKNAECGKRFCTSACEWGRNISGKECVECNNKFCKNDMWNCTGMGPDQLPPDPSKD